MDRRALALVIGLGLPIVMVLAPLQAIVVRMSPHAELFLERADDIDPSLPVRTLNTIDVATLPTKLAAAIHTAITSGNAAVPLDPLIASAWAKLSADPNATATFVKVGKVTLFVQLVVVPSLLERLERAAGSWVCVARHETDCG